MGVFGVFVSALTLINVAVTQPQSSQEFYFDETLDLNQLCGPLGEASGYEDDQPTATYGEEHSLLY